MDTLFYTLVSTALVLTIAMMAFLLKDAITDYRMKRRQTKQRPIVVIESPYAGDVANNCAYARLCVKDSLIRGEAPFALHLLYTQAGILDDNIASEREQGIASGLEFCRVCDIHVFYTDRGWSQGMLAAYKSAIENHEKIELRSLYGKQVHRPQ